MYMTSQLLHNQNIGRKLDMSMPTGREQTPTAHAQR